MVKDLGDVKMTNVALVANVTLVAGMSEESGVRYSSNWSSSFL